MLCEMVGVKARTIEQLDDREPLFILIRQGRAAGVEMIEDSEFHCGTLPERR